MSACGNVRFANLLTVLIGSFFWPQSKARGRLRAKEKRVFFSCMKKELGASERQVLDIIEGSRANKKLNREINEI
jgi:hypothetical protein